MSKTANTWELMKSSWQVLMRDKVLLLFPLFSSVACLLVLLTFVIPVLGLGGAGMRSLARGTGGAAGYVLLFGYYLCNFFVVFFFNAALVAFVTARLRGGEPTLGSSLNVAVACLPQIAAWSVIASTVGVILKALESRAGFLGQIVMSLVGVAWTLVTFFVVPIIVVEHKGAMDAIGGSKELLAKTWGRQIVSGLGYGILGFLLTVPAIIVIALAIVGVAASGGAHAGGWGALAVLAVLYLIALTIVLSTLRAIFGTVLYLFAQSGTAPAGFDANNLRGAIQPA